jgi:hypothetical protein
MKFKLVIISLFLFIFCCCNDEDKEKLEFINELIKHPENMAIIIKNSKFAMSEDNYYDNTINFFQNNLIDHPIQLKNILVEEPSSPKKLINNEFVKFQTFIIEEDHNNANSLAFEFVQLKNSEWKLKSIFLLKNPNF